MGLLDLSIQSMVEVSAPWIDPEAIRAQFESVPLLASLLPVVDEAHQGLLAVQAEEPSADVLDALREIMEESAAADATSCAAFIC